MTANFENIFMFNVAIPGFGKAVIQFWTYYK